MAKNKTNYAYIEKIIYSSHFRNMQDKTQLFYSAPERQVRTRLTHTIEVKTIAYSIGNNINKKLRKKLIDLDLVDAIAFAHDIGHTPFGHVGERTIDEIVSGKDSLGGMIPTGSPNKMRFKHNVNSLRLLKELDVQDWRILDGALCHTRVFYKGDDYPYEKNPYNPFTESPSKFDRFFQEQHGFLLEQTNRKKFHSLTLEGQIVAIADEIAQRVADISDGLESRYFGVVKDILAIGNDKKITTRSELEQIIRKILIEDVVSNTAKNIKATAAAKETHRGISHDTYKTEVICFSPKRKEQNENLEKYITVMMAQSEDVRESDSRSKYIIRQLFKAYLNDISLLPDKFIDNYFRKIINKSSFIKAKDALRSADKLREKSNVFEQIGNQSWRYRKGYLDKNKLVIDLRNVREFFTIIAKEDNVHYIPELNDLLDEYILQIGFHIAGMTNTEAFTAYNRIYGH